MNEYPFANVTTESTLCELVSEVLAKLDALPDRIRYRIFAGVCVVVPAAMLAFVWLIIR